MMCRIQSLFPDPAKRFGSHRIRNTGLKKEFENFLKIIIFGNSRVADKFSFFKPDLTICFYGSGS